MGVSADEIPVGSVALHEFRKYRLDIDDIAAPRPFLGREPARGRLCVQAGLEDVGVVRAVS